MANQGLLANLPRPESLMVASKDSKTLGRAIVQLLNNWYLMFQNVVRNTGIWTPQPNGTPIFANDNDQTGTTLAVNATFNPFGNSPNFSGMFLVNELAGGRVGLFLQGGAAVVLVAVSFAGVYTTISGNAGTINVFLTGAGASAVVTVENKFAPVEIRIMGLRVRSAT